MCSKKLDILNEHIQFNPETDTRTMLKIAASILLHQIAFRVFITQTPHTYHMKQQNLDEIIRRLYRFQCRIICIISGSGVLLIILLCAIKYELNILSKCGNYRSDSKDSKADV